MAFTLRASLPAVVGIGEGSRLDERPHPIRPSVTSPSVIQWTGSSRQQWETLLVQLFPSAVDGATVGSIACNASTSMVFTSSPG